MPTLGERIQKAWNAFRNKDPTESGNIIYYGPGSSYRPDRKRFHPQAERSIIAPMLNRMAVDASTIELKHVQLDDQLRYKDDIKDSLNDVLTVEANIDQTSRSFRQDIYSSLLDEGYIAVCPVKADLNPETGTIDLFRSVRVGRITQWFPRHVEVELYNEDTGRRELVKQPKALCLILQNPFYEIMNAPNSLLVRLRKKLAMLDMLDDRNASGKLDMIIQLPYATRTGARREQAQERKDEIEMQLAGSKYGIAYIDATERVIQLNRPLDNNLIPQIDSLTKQLQDQLGISAEILNGSADDVAKQNYLNDIIEPLVSTLVDEMKRKWLTKNARSRGESIMFFKDPFRLIPVDKIADMADKFTRNEIMSSNEFRVKCGLKPSEQPGADELRNKNLNQSNKALEAQGLDANGPEQENGVPNEQLGLDAKELETLNAIEGNSTA